MYIYVFYNRALCVYAHMYVCVCVCMYVCMYVSRYVCIYVGIYLYVYINTYDVYIFESNMQTYKDIHVILSCKHRIIYIYACIYHPKDLTEAALACLLASPASPPVAGSPHVTTDPSAFNASQIQAKYSESFNTGMAAPSTARSSVGVGRMRHTPIRMMPETLRNTGSGNKPHHSATEVVKGSLSRLEHSSLKTLCQSERKKQENSNPHT